MLVRVALVSSLAIGCVKHLPPAPTPQPADIAVNTSAPVEPGSGRLVVDVVDGPTPVREITMRPEPVERSNGDTSFQFFEDDEVVCPTTPCVINRPAGNIILGFPVIGDGGLRIDMVHIGAEASAYRRSLAVYKRPGNRTLKVLGVIATSVGGASVATGAALLPIGLSGDNDTMAFAGAISLAAGALLTTLGIITINGQADTFRPGSSIHYPL